MLEAESPSRGAGHVVVWGAIILALPLLTTAGAGAGSYARGGRSREWWEPFPPKGR